MTTAVIITGLICITVIIVYAISSITESISYSKYLEAQAKYPEAFKLTPEEYQYLELERSINKKTFKEDY